MKISVTAIADHSISRTKYEKLLFLNPSNRIPFLSTNGTYRKGKKISKDHTPPTNHPPLINHNMNIIKMGPTLLMNKSLAMSLTTRRLMMDVSAR